LPITELHVVVLVIGSRVESSWSSTARCVVIPVDIEGELYTPRRWHLPIPVYGKSNQ